MSALPRASNARDLGALFDPTSVAIVGASNDVRKWGNWLSTQAKRMSHRRPVYLINKRGQDVLGEPTFRRLTEVDAAIDLAVITVPAAAFEQAVDDALAAGARAIIGISGGFAELGNAGRRCEQSVVARVRAAGAVLLGPNCLGALDSSAELYLTGNELPAGAIGLVSQSGNTVLEVGRRLSEHGLGFSRVASLGNQADIKAADLIRSYAEHEPTQIIAVYCEDFADGRDFISAAAECKRAGKEIVLLTVGASAAAQRGALSHTGALTTDADVIDAACRAGGIRRVSTVREMTNLLRALSAFPRARPRRIAIISDGGGHASIAADLAAVHGLAVPEFGPELQSNLRRHLLPSSSTANPIDLAGAGEQDLTNFARVLQAALTTDEVDAALITGYFGGFVEYGPDLAAIEIDTAKSISCLAEQLGKPVLVQSMFADGEAAQLLDRSGVPVFDAAEDAISTLGLLARVADVRDLELPAAQPAIQDVDYWSARNLLAGAGIEFPAARLVTSVASAVDAAEEIGFPVAVKAMGLLHKSDVGGVLLGLADRAAVRTACVDLTSRLHPPAFSVEAMADAPDGVELIVGVRQDARFGPTVMVGMGGLLAEVLRDVTFELAPLSPDDASRMLNSLRLTPLLNGIRGRRPIDVPTAARTIVALATLAAQHPELAEIEVNPMLVTPHGVIALDARAVLARV